MRFLKLFVCIFLGVMAAILILFLAKVGQWVARIALLAAVIAMLIYHFMGKKKE